MMGRTFILAPILNLGLLAIIVAVVILAIKDTRKGYGTINSNIMEKKLGPKEVIVQILSIIALYVSVGALFGVVFAFIDALFPGVVSAVGVFDVPNESVRFAVATLIIAFPLFVWLSRLVEKEVAALGAGTEFLTRKWLLYITIALAGAAIAGTAVSVLFSYLNGDITARFIAKALTIVVVSAAGLTYYRALLKSGAADAMKKMVPLVYAVNIVVVAAIAVGLMLSGSPSKVRAYNQDRDRANDLMSIQIELNSYWSKKIDLPAALKDAEDPNSYFVVPTDPATGAAYEYKKLSTKSYELCATFALPSRPKGANEYTDPAEVYFQHSDGRVCFTRNVDESLRDPNVKPVPIGL